jgi:hypothetical protein
MSVPAAYVGLWRRTVIRRAGGVEDRSTRVLWFQGARYHIDLRTSADGCTQIAFAGTTVVEDARCEWRPEIAYPAISEEIDAGIMRFDAPDRLHEAGVDGSYDEDWVKIDAGPVSEQRFEFADGAIGYLIQSAAWLAWAHGRPDSGAEVGFAQREGDHWRVVACNNAAREGEVSSRPPSVPAGPDR